MNFPDVMVDLETTGTQPENTNIIQIAAVRFNANTGAVDTDFFNQCLLPLPTRFWDEDTRRWWGGQPHVLEKIYRNMKDPYTVVKDFSDWVRDGSLGDPVMWAKPISFEFPFLSSYFRELEVVNPFHFRLANDMNTFIRARFYPNPAPNIEKELEFEGDAHDAIFDVLHQIKTLMTAIERTT